MASEYTSQDFRTRAHYLDAFYDDKRTANMLLQASDMVERCERLIGCTFYLEDGHTNIDHIIKHQVNYILHGDAGKGADDDK